MLDDAVAGIGTGGAGVFPIRYAKEEDGGDAGGMGGGGFDHDFIGGKLKDAGHGVDGAAEFAAGAGEEGQHELGGIELGFGDEATQDGGLAQSTGSDDGVSGQIHGAMVVFTG